MPKYDRRWRGPDGRWQYSYKTPRKDPKDVYQHDRPEGVAGERKPLTLRKSGGHKYVSRRRGPKGWIYKYSDGTTRHVANAKVKMTPAQQAAVEVYVTDPAHTEDPEDGPAHRAVAELVDGRTLHIPATDVDHVRRVLTDASNSADDEAQYKRVDDVKAANGMALALANLGAKVSRSHEAPMSKSRTLRKSDRAREGSRGGHVIGHTASGKPIYATAGKPKRGKDHADRYEGWSLQDHKDAHNAHNRNKEDSRASTWMASYHKEMAFAAGSGATSSGMSAAREHAARAHKAATEDHRDAKKKAEDLSAQAWRDFGDHTDHANAAQAHLEALKRAEAAENKSATRKHTSAANQHHEEHLDGKAKADAKPIATTPNGKPVFGAEGHPHVGNSWSMDDHASTNNAYEGHPFRQHTSDWAPSDHEHAATKLAASDNKADRHLARAHKELAKVKSAPARTQASVDAGQAMSHLDLALRSMNKSSAGPLQPLHAGQVRPAWVRMPGAASMLRNRRDPEQRYLNDLYTARGMPKPAPMTSDGGPYLAGRDVVKGLGMPPAKEAAIARSVDQLARTSNSELVLRKAMNAWRHDHPDIEPSLRSELGRRTLALFREKRRQQGDYVVKSDRPLVLSIDLAKAFSGDGAQQLLATALGTARHGALWPETASEQSSNQKLLDHVKAVSTDHYHAKDVEAALKDAMRTHAFHADAKSKARAASASGGQKPRHARTLAATKDAHDAAMAKLHSTIYMGPKGGRYSDPQRKHALAKAFPPGGGGRQSQRGAQAPPPNKAVNVKPGAPPPERQTVGRPTGNVPGKQAPKAAPPPEPGMPGDPTQSHPDEAVLDTHTLEENGSHPEHIQGKLRQFHQELQSLHESIVSEGQIHMHNDIVDKMRDAYANPTPEALEQVSHQLHHFAEMLQGPEMEQPDDGQGPPPVAAPDDAGPPPPTSVRDEARKALVLNFDLIKGAALPVGTHRKWSGMEMVKVGPGKWQPAPGSGQQARPDAGGSRSAASAPSAPQQRPPPPPADASPVPSTPPPTPREPPQQAQQQQAQPQQAQPQPQQAQQQPQQQEQQGPAGEQGTPPPEGMEAYQPDPTEDGDGDGIADASRVGVCGSCVHPPGSIPRLPNLTAHERAIEHRFAKAFEDDPDAVTAEFTKQLAAGAIGDAPNIFALDDAKLLSPDYNPQGVPHEVVLDSRGRNNVLVHQTANAIVKRAFLQKLDELAKLPDGDPKKAALVTSGGVAAGKGYALGKVSEASKVAEQVGAVWDAAGEQNGTENPWLLEECKKRGIKATFVYVDSDPTVTWGNPARGVVERAAKKGRMVDARLFADSYAHGAKNFKAFHDKHKDSGAADFILLSSRVGDPKRVNDFPPEALSRSADDIYAEASKVMDDRAKDLKPAVLRGGTVGRRIWGS